MGMLSLNEKLGGVTLGGMSYLDVAYARVQHLAVRPHGCPRFAANLAIILDILSLSKKE